MDSIVLNSVSHNYIREASYFDYLNEKIYQENNLAYYIQKTLDVHNSRTINGINEAVVLYEAKISDNIKAKWKKFLTFMKSIYQKFIANLSKVLLSEKTYLKKYQDIILKKPGKDIEFTYYGNYDKGIQRITSVKVPEFDWATMSPALLKEGDGDAVNLLMKGSNFTYNDGENLSTQLKEFFTGYEDGETRTTIEKFNLRKAYDFCIGFDKIKARTDADYDTLEKATRKIEDAINKQIGSADKEVETNADATTNDQKQPESGNNNQPTATPAAETPKAESAFSAGVSYYTRSNKIFTEAPDEANANDKPAPGNTGLKITDVAKASASYDGTRNPENGTLQNNANAAKGSSADNVNTVINKYISISKSIITAKWTASEQIARDYMKIINAHVKSYAGTKADEGAKKTAAPQTDFNNSKQEKTPQQAEENNNK